jgi:hypothetical protein
MLTNAAAYSHGLVIPSVEEEGEPIEPVLKRAELQLLRKVEKLEI